MEIAPAVTEPKETRLQHFWKTAVWPFKVFVFSRLGLILLVYFSLLFLPMNSALDTWRLFPKNQFLDGWVRWDGAWYSDIAENGYSDQGKYEGQKNVVFFPLYPLLVRHLNSVTHNTGLSGILVSNFSFLLALVLLFELISNCYGVSVGKWTVILLTTFPFAFYFGAMYTEALFLLLVVGAFYFGEREQWFRASLFAGLASATRSIGITVAFGLSILYLSKTNFKIRAIRRDILWLSLGVLGLGLYMGFLGYKFGDPLLFATARQEGWEAGLGLDAAWRTVRASLSIRSIISGNYPALNLLHIGLSVLSVLLIGCSWRKLKLAHAVWALVCIVVSFIPGWHGMGRFLLPIFPIFTAIPLLIDRQDGLITITYVDTLLLALFTIMYSHWYWVS